MPAEGILVEGQEVFEQQQQEELLIPRSARYSMLHQQLQQQADSGSASQCSPAALPAAREQAHALFAEYMHMLVPSAAVPVAREAGASEADVATTATTAAADAVPDPSRRRRRRSNGKQQAQQQQQLMLTCSQDEDEQSAAPSSAGVAVGRLQLGRVHELSANRQPPPAHEGQPVVYVLLNNQGWWYVGESQVRDCTRMDYSCKSHPISCLLQC